MVICIRTKIWFVSFTFVVDVNWGTLWPSPFANSIIYWSYWESLWIPYNNFPNRICTFSSFMNCGTLIQGSTMPRVLSYRFCKAGFKDPSFFLKTTTGLIIHWIRRVVFPSSILVKFNWFWIWCLKMTCIFKNCLGWNILFCCLRATLWKVVICFKGTIWCSSISSIWATLSTYWLLTTGIYWLLRKAVFYISSLFWSPSNCQGFNTLRRWMVKTSLKYCSWREIIWKVWTVFPTRDCTFSDVWSWVIFCLWCLCIVLSWLLTVIWCASISMNLGVDCWWWSTYAIYIVFGWEVCGYLLPTYVGRYHVLLTVFIGVELAAGHSS